MTDPRTDPMLCQLCKTEFPIDSYGEGACPNCGQAYEYDEMYFMKLSDRQLQLLRDNPETPE